MSDTIAREETDRLIASDRVEGTDVYNPKDEKLGTVQNFMVNKSTGQAEYAVMEFGGLFGIGSDHYPIPWNMLKYDEDREGYVVNLNKSQIEGAPTYRPKGTSFDQAYSKKIYGHYGMAYPYL